jgi:tetratricopeptide (TPR) repeat protein
MWRPRWSWCGGSTTECRRAIDDAFAHLDSPTTTAPDWSYWLNPGHAHGQAGFCYLKLGDHSAARRHFRQALRLQDPNAAREGALRYTLLATTYVRQDDPDLDQALALAGHAVEILADDVSSNRCIGHLNTLSRDLAPHNRRPGVRHLAEQVQSLRAVPSGVG